MESYHDQVKILYKSQQLQQIKSQCCGSADVLPGFGVVCYGYITSALSTCTISRVSTL